jgi:hypothetical protein
VEETVLVRVEDDREEGCNGFEEVLFRVEVDEVREGTGACIGGCEVEGPLVLGAGLVAASAISFSKALTFLESESTWKLSFLRSLSTLRTAGGKNASEIRKQPPPTSGTCHRSSRSQHTSLSDLPPSRRIVPAALGGAPPNLVSRGRRRVRAAMRPRLPCVENP